MPPILEDDIFGMLSCQSDFQIVPIIITLLNLKRYPIIFFFKKKVPVLN